MSTKFEVEVFIKTRPVGFSEERIESFTIVVEASSFGHAQELAFARIKNSASYEDLMNQLTVGTLKPKKGHE